MKSKAIENHERAVRAAKTYLASERELLAVLRDQDEIKGYVEFGATSLHDYAFRILGLPEHTAYDLINVARKSREVPELARAVQSGELTLTKARRIVPVITQENKSEWIELAASSNKREIEKAVKTEKPELAVQESARFVARDRIELKCGISEEVYDKLKRVMDLESQRLQSAANQEQAITAALDAYLAKHDPLLKAERARDRELRKQAKEVSLGQSERSGGVPVRTRGVSALRLNRVTNRLGPGRVRIPAALAHAVRLRDQNRCSFSRGDGSRCECRRWLDIHHIVPVELGGANSLENLVTLCRAHHQFMHANVRLRSSVRQPEVAYGACVFPTILPHAVETLALKRTEVRETVPVFDKRVFSGYALAQIS